MSSAGYGILEGNSTLPSSAAVERLFSDCLVLLHRYVWRNTQSAYLSPITV